MSINIRDHQWLICGAIFCASACLQPEVNLEEDDAALSEREQPSPGAAGIGDSLFPNLGNGGYQVEHYKLDLRYPTTDPLQPIDGTVTIEARATQALSRFNLDFSGDAIGTVEVDGCDATHTWDGEEVVITPSRPLRRNERFTIRIAHFTASPRVPDPEVFLGAPFFVHTDGTAWANQPHNAHQIFPSNDHPRDMATYSFRLDVPEGTTAVANGKLKSRHTAGSRTIWRYEQRQPMATELAQVVVGAMTVTDRGKHDGVRVRDVTPTRLTAGLDAKLALETAHLDWMTAQVGDYPFDTYGSLVVESPIGFALETQTLSLYPTFLFDIEQAVFEPIMVHELAHQWFGNSVSPHQWSDVWQNEGHATWYELTYAGGPDAPELIELMQLVYGFSDQLRAGFGPVAQPLSGDPSLLFNPNVYYGGALVLFALRQQIGDAAFREVEREWVRTYRGRSASTDDFIALASRVSGQDLTAFLGDWLYSTTTPPMPGYPDWVVEPVPETPADARAATMAVPQLVLPHRHHVPLVRY